MKESQLHDALNELDEELDEMLDLMEKLTQQLGETGDEASVYTKNITATGMPFPACFWQPGIWQRAGWRIIIRCGCLWRLSLPRWRYSRPTPLYWKAPPCGSPFLLMPSSHLLSFCLSSQA